ncbi:hypothetical protein SSS_01733 [Sarcoptes scabiei]|uniref:Uncharacterized protein n=2 Tax=Sarcoptes scabiei TaxID=52283 RepID=A0A834VD98_SARSC|nr:hypothetical protein SSS_01733 [Sarcoptes scabiei]
MFANFYNSKRRSKIKCYGLNLFPLFLLIIVTIQPIISFEIIEKESKPRQQNLFLRLFHSRIGNDKQESSVRDNKNLSQKLIKREADNVTNIQLNSIEEDQLNFTGKMENILETTENYSKDFESSQKNIVPITLNTRNDDEQMNTDSEWGMNFDDALSLAIESKELSSNQSKGDVISSFNDTNFAQNLNKTFDPMVNFADTDSKVLMSDKKSINETSKIMTNETKKIDTGNEEDDSFSPWMIIILILVPIIIIAMIMLLMLSRSTRQKPSKSIVSSLEHPVKLLPTLPKEHYFPQLNLVRNKPEPKHYYLDVDTAVKFMQTNQLYHPQSGIIFQLCPNLLFDPLRGVCIRSDSGQTEIPTPNQVYSSFTNEIFFRYLFMAYDPHRKSFFLPTETELTNSVPRIAIRNVPDGYVNTYQNLLQTTRLPEIVAQKASDSTSESKLGKMNPLLIDNRDFSKPQTADFRETPRSMMMKSDKSLKKVELDEKSNYVDAKSTLIKI